MTSAVTNTVSQPEDEFSSLPDLAAALGLGAPPAVVRKRVQLSAGGQLSGVVWADGTPELTILPGDGAHARDADRIALRTDVPLLALDPLGAGRSPGWSSPRSTVRSLSEAVLAVAPQTRILVGIGAPASTVAGLAARLPKVDTLFLIDVRPEADRADEAVLWDQLAAGRAAVTVVRSVDSPIDWAAAQRLSQSRPDATVVDLLTPSEQIYDQASTRIALELRFCLAAVR